MNNRELYIRHAGHYIYFLSVGKNGIRQKNESLYLVFLETLNESEEAMPNEGNEAWPMLTEMVW